MTHPEYAALAAALERLGVDHQGQDGDAFLITLPGERRHRTLAWLVLGTHELLIESFVCRRPDENDLGVYRFLLQRNAKLRTVSYTVDASGDIHLVGRLGWGPLLAGGENTLDAELDTVLGVLLTASDEDFNPILERGFAGAIRREWAWRTDRGDSVRNLEAFRHLIQPS